MTQERKFVTVNPLFARPGENTVAAKYELSDDGVNPLTGKRVVSAENIPHILAEMTMEGLYEASGDWAYTVGLPGKSGVGGGIVCVAPGLLPIAAFSPRLDQFGNSVRAQAAITQIAQELKLNLYLGTGGPRAATQLGARSGITNEALVSTPH